MTSLLALVSSIGIALTAIAEPPARVRDVKVAVGQSNAEPPAQPTAEDVLKALRHRRPANEVIPPGSRAARDAVSANSRPADRLLMPEGLSLVGRTGRLSQEGQWWVFAFDDDASVPSMKLLPNASLEMMVGAFRGAPAPIRFSISGELTVFDGENYLLPRTALRAAGTANQTAAHESSAANDGSGKSPPSARPRPDASAEEVLAAMQAQKPLEAVLPPGASPSDGEGPTGAVTDSDSLAPDGTPLMNRIGRLVRQGSWWTLVSDSDRPDQPDRPLRLLPNQSVESMVRGTQHSGGGVFTVSGELTMFDGENYLLTRVATRRVDTGNLRR